MELNDRINALERRQSAYEQEVNQIIENMTQIILKNMNGVLSWQKKQDMAMKRANNLYFEIMDKSNTANADSGGVVLS